MYLFTYVDSILLLTTTINIYGWILTKELVKLVYIINNFILSLEWTRDIINEINIYIDINNIPDLSKDSKDETLVNIRVVLSRLGFN